MGLDKPKLAQFTGPVVDTEALFGVGEAKPLEALASEVQGGASRLMPLGGAWSMMLNCWGFLTFDTEIIQD